MNLTLTTNPAQVTNAAGNVLVKIAVETIRIPRDTIIDMMPGTTVDRARLMALAITMAANWVQAGRPELPTAPKAIYEAMDKAWRRDKPCPLCFAGPVESVPSIDFEQVYECPQCGVQAHEKYDEREQIHDAHGWSRHIGPVYEIRGAA